MSDERLQQLIRDSAHAESLAPLVAQLQRAGVDPIVLAVELLRGARGVDLRLVELCERAYGLVTHVQAFGGGALCGARSASAKELPPSGAGFVVAGPTHATCVLCLRLAGRCASCDGPLTALCRRCTPADRTPRCPGRFRDTEVCTLTYGHAGLHRGNEGSQWSDARRSSLRRRGPR